MNIFASLKMKFFFYINKFFNDYKDHSTTAIFDICFFKVSNSGSGKHQ